jgi:hypothetical protein
LNSFEDIVEEVVNDFIDRGHVARDKHDFLKSIILSQHRSKHSISGNIAGQKPIPLSELYGSNYKHSRLNESHSVSENLGHLLKTSSFIMHAKHNKNNKSEDTAHINESQYVSDKNVF